MRIAGAARSYVCRASSLWAGREYRVNRVTARKPILRAVQFAALAGGLN